MLSSPKTTVACVPQIDTTLAVRIVAGVLTAIPGGMWVYLRWSVPGVNWIADNSYTRSACGEQDKTERVRFVWLATADNDELPILHIEEGPDDDGQLRKANAVLMGRKLAPFAHQAVSQSTLPRVTHPVLCDGVTALGHLAVRPPAQGGRL